VSAKDKSKLIGSLEINIVNFENMMIILTWPSKYNEEASIISMLALTLCQLIARVIAMYRCTNW
jgi:hypothetical protein